MFDQTFLFKLAMMDNNDLQRYLGKEGYKTFFQKHEGGTRMHDLNIF